MWDMSMDWSDWKCTPMHFIMYNLVPGNLDKHGTHPWYLHLVNLLMLFGPLGIIALWSGVQFFGEMFTSEWRNKPGIRTIYALTMFAFVTPLGLLCLIPHQEPRFLLPLILPVVLMNAHKLRVKGFGGSKPLLFLWYLFNIGGLCFFGFTHQGGVTQLLNKNNRIFPSIPDNVGQVNIVFSHTYMPPTFQLLLPPTNKSRITTWHFEYPLYFNDQIPKLNIVQMGSKPVDVNVKQKLIELIMDQQEYPNKNSKTFVAIPTLLIEKLEKSVRNILEFSTVYYTFPHVSVESLSEISNVFEMNELDFNIIKYWERTTNDISQSGITRYLIKRVVGCLESISLFGFSVIEVKLSSDVESAQFKNINHMESGNERINKPTSKVKKSKRNEPVKSQKNE